MANLTSQTKSYLKLTYPELNEIPYNSLPPWMQNSRWKPSLCLYSKERGVYLAVAIQTSWLLPFTFFEREVVPLLNEYKRQLIVMVCVPDKAWHDNPETEEFCKEMGFGFKVLEPGLGLDTIIRIQLDPPPKLKAIPQEPGYFPEAILDRAVGLKKLIFSDIIDEFVEKIRLVQKIDDLNNNEIKRLSIDTINKLLCKHPSFKDNISFFMQLEHFETLMQLTSPTSSEHIYHSIRVFLAGCPIINFFYDDFDRAHGFYSGVCKEVYVEYSWLLTSIFHDVGRPKEGIKSLVYDELQDDDISIEITGKSGRWQKEGYRDALRILSSLATYIGCKAKSVWDGGTIADQEGRMLEEEWIRIYDQFESHAVISAIDFLSKVYDNARAADEREYRPFVLAHSVPAALAILLHDWRIQNNAVKWKLFPIDVKRLPLAGLLVYLDTWDDFKRKDTTPNIFIKEYKINKKGVHVFIEWGDSTLFENEIKKYEAFKKSLSGGPFQMKITATMVK